MKGFEDVPTDHAAPEKWVRSGRGIASGASRGAKEIGFVPFPGCFAERSSPSDRRGAEIAERSAVGAQIWVSVAIWGGMLSVLREHEIAWKSLHAHGVPRACHPSPPRGAHHLASACENWVRSGAGNCGLGRVDSAWSPVTSRMAGVGRRNGSRVWELVGLLSRYIPWPVEVANTVLPVLPAFFSPAHQPIVPGSPLNGPTISDVIQPP
jgi:hypothetical protein